MSLLTRFMEFLKKMFHINTSTQEVPKISIEPYEEGVDTLEEDLLENIPEDFEQFKTHNIVFEKLNYLEQYIKIFSLNFPDEYSNYLKTIQAHRSEYEVELENYRNGLSGNITFAIDPECESKRLIAVATLEDEIKDFVEFVVNFSNYKNKFSKLCSKLNQFYNALLDTTRGTDVICSQLNSATQTMTELVNEVKSLQFFKKDTRKKEEIFNYIIYGEYIFLKSCIRCNLIQNSEEFKSNLSHFYDLFMGCDYDNLMFKFFIEDLEQYQIYITTNLSQDTTYSYVLKSCDRLQARLNDYQTAFADSSFFVELIQFENTVDNISEEHGVEFKIPLPQILEFTNSSSTNISIKDLAVSILNMLKSTKAKILSTVIHNFNTDISWREFYFLCKIFEVHDDIIAISHNTIFGSIKSKFLQLSTRYSEYSDDYIRSEKEKLLNYNGSKTKRYVLLLTLSQNHLPIITTELKTLRLDYVVSGQDIYLNHSYFNGFKNLEKNFGNYKTLEDLL